MTGKRPVKLAYGARYSDDSGWQWLVEASVGSDRETWIKVTAVGGDIIFRPETVNPREIARALDLIADALGIPALPEESADA